MYKYQKTYRTSNNETLLEVVSTITQVIQLSLNLTKGASNF